MQPVNTNGGYLDISDLRDTDPGCTREQILDAALRCYQRNTFQKTRIEQIAQEANISRTSIYRHVGRRDDVAIAVIFREFHILSGLIRDRVAGKKYFSEFLVESLVVASEKIQSSIVFNIITKEPLVLRTRLYPNYEEISSIARSYFYSRFHEAQSAGELRAGISFEIFIEWIINVGISTHIQPEIFRHLLWQFFVPSIVFDKAI